MMPLLAEVRAMQPAAVRLRFRKMLRRMTEMLSRSLEHRARGALRGKVFKVLVQHQQAAHGPPHVLVAPPYPIIRGRQQQLIPALTPSAMPGAVQCQHMQVVRA